MKVVTRQDCEECLSGLSEEEVRGGFTTEEESWDSFSLGKYGSDEKTTTRIDDVYRTVLRTTDF